MSSRTMGQVYCTKWHNSLQTKYTLYIEGVHAPLRHTTYMEGVQKHLLKPLTVFVEHRMHGIKTEFKVFILHIYRVASHLVTQLPKLPTDQASKSSC